MLDTRRCPEPEQLHGFVRGGLDEVLRDAVDEHLEACGRCLDAVESLDRQAAVLSEMLRRTPLPAGLPEEPELSRLVQRAKSAFADGPNDTATTVHAAGVLAGMPAGGASLGPYLLVREIGSGGMGTVFLAEHRRMKRRVALKMLAPDWIRSPTARARFQHEIEAVARLNSPHIVAAHDAGEDAGRDYLAMEYVEGTTLADRVHDQGPLPLAEALETTVQAARGLEHAHAAGIVHRDIKPHNLLVDAQGTVKILDLGLARLLFAAEDRPSLTAHHVMGTAAYMAPEQAKDTHHVDGRADVYSLGCTLFFLLTGRPPYQADSSLETLCLHRQQPIPAPSDFRPDCPAEVDDLLRELLAKGPDDRPRSMGEVIARVEGLLERMYPGGQPHDDPRPPRRKPTRWLWAAGFVAAAACLALVPLVWPGLFGSHQPNQVAEGARAVEESGPRSERPAIPDPKATPEIDGIDLVVIKPGTFWMGSAAEDPNASAVEQPRHQVRITQPFRLAKHMVTQELYEKVMGTNPSAFSPSGRFKSLVKVKDTARHPVESISWLDAVHFCNRLSERHGLEPYYKLDKGQVSIRGGTGYRLPTEAEWEYACRAGQETTWFFGGSAGPLGDFAWYAGNSGGTTHPVATKKPNPWGLYDMLGNVSEWCWDRYDPNYYKHSPTSDPPGAGAGTSRVHRGGSWNATANQTRPAVRESRGMAYSVLTIVGLRLARGLES